MAVYGIVGQAGQYLCKEWEKPAGAIEMQTASPSPAAIAQADGTWIEPPIDPKTRLAEIDLESSRPLRAILAGTATQEDHDKLAALEAEAIQLRASIKE